MDSPYVPYRAFEIAAPRQPDRAWYPLTGRELRFEDVELRIQPRGTFTVRLLVDDVRVPTRLQGRWHVEDEIVATAVVVGTAS